MAQLLLAGLSPRKPQFDPGLVLVRFVMDILALELVLIIVIPFSPATNKCSVVLFVLMQPLPQRQTVESSRTSKCKALSEVREGGGGGGVGFGGLRLEGHFHLKNPSKRLSIEWPPTNFDYLFFLDISLEYLSLVVHLYGP